MNGEISKSNAQPLSTENAKQLVNSVDAFLFDCDGVIWKGDKLIDGVPQTLEMLRSLGKKLVFVTNNSTKSRKKYAEKFHSLGIPVNEYEIFSSSFAAAMYLKVNDFPTEKKVYVIGEEGILEELELAGFTALGGPADGKKNPELKSNCLFEHDKSVGAVVVGLDQYINFYKLQYGALCIRENPGCLFIATNRDASGHLTDLQEWPGAGCMVAAVCGATQKEPIVVGKPSTFLMDFLLQKYNITTSRMCMVPAMEVGYIFNGNIENVAPMFEEHSKDDIVPLASNVASSPMISPAPSVSLTQVNDNLTTRASCHNRHGATTTQNDEVAVIVPLNSNATSQPMNSPAPSVSPRHVGDNSTAVASSHNPYIVTSTPRNGSTTTNSPAVKEATDRPVEGVVSISEMTKMMLGSHPSSLLTKPMWSSASDEGLRSAMSQIESAANIISDPGLHAPVYHNVSKFKRSYELMERNLKVYIYREGKRPVFHQPRLKGIYASEGWFMQQLKASQHFLTNDPNKAHLFYLPFSSQILGEVVYVRGSHSFTNLKAYLKNYVDLIKGRYPFWNRTQGADHFLVACHDWAPEETRHEMANCIKSFCNADLKEGFKLGKDASLPETNIGSADPSRSLGGKRPSQRKFLAFFAGSMHGYVRPILLKYWQNKDPNMKIFGRMHKTDYIQHMKSSRYCICARGYEVNSPRVVEAISYECVPVIISDNFVPPFLETLNWEAFAVFIQEKDIPNLKSILESIPLRRYLKLYNNVKKVQQHFLWRPEPVKYDIFHMILHSIWYNRVFQIAS